MFKFIYMYLNVYINFMPPAARSHNAPKDSLEKITQVT